LSSFNSNKQFIRGGVSAKKQTYQMNLSPEDRQHLSNIINAVDEIESYVQYEDYNEFREDEVAKEAVTRVMADLGGASKLLSDEFKAQYGDVDWDALIRLEDAMYNQAEEWDYEGIWQIIKNDLPEIRSQVADLAANVREEDDIHGFDLTEDPNTF
jgi:uncharacterized protein with HEPN domain